MHARLAIIFSLGFSSGLPMALISTTLQAWFADVGASVLTTGMLSLLSLPFAYRLILSPLIDRFTILPIGKRRSWMLFTQLVLLIGFNILASLSPINFPQAIIVIAISLAIFATCQDAAIDAYRVECLQFNEYNMGATSALLGYRLALMIAGGFALIMAKHLGWTATYHMMGCLMLIGIITTFCAKESKPVYQPKINFLQMFIEPAKELYHRSNIIYLLFFILFYKFGTVFTSSTSGIVIPFLLQGIGFPLEIVGAINKIFGTIAIILGGITAGFLLNRWSLFSALFLFGLLQTLAIILFLLLAIVGKDISLLAISVGIDNFAAGMSATALVVLFMRLVNKQYVCAQFSILVAFASLPNIFSGPIAAILQSYFGWVGLYKIALILAFCFIPFLFLIRESYLGKKDFEILSLE